MLIFVKFYSQKEQKFGFMFTFCDKRYGLCDSMYCHGRYFCLIYKLIFSAISSFYKIGDNMPIISQSTPPPAQSYDLSEKV